MNIRKHDNHGRSVEHSIDITGYVATISQMTTTSG